MDFLSADGYHIDSRYDTVLDRTYACALVGTHVPQPVSEDTFVPGFVRRSWDSQWPRLVGRAREGPNIP